MTKRSKRAEKLPKMNYVAERTAFIDLMIGLDELFYAALKRRRKFHARYIYELRPIYQRVMRNHLNGETSTAHRLAKDTAMKRPTVERILNDLVRIRWLARSGSHYWISKKVATLPVMPRTAYDAGAKLIFDVAARLRAATRP